MTSQVVYGPREFVLSYGEVSQIIASILRIVLTMEHRRRSTFRRWA